MTASYLFDRANSSIVDYLDIHMRDFSVASSGRAGAFVVSWLVKATYVELDVRHAYAEFGFAPDMQIWQETTANAFRTRIKTEIRYVPARMENADLWVDRLMALPETDVAMRLKEERREEIEEILLLKSIGGAGPPLEMILG